MSIQADKTTDVSCRAQFNIILRYVYKNDIIEMFIGFYDVLSDKMTKGLIAKLLEVMNAKLQKNSFYKLMMVQMYNAGGKRFV